MLYDCPSHLRACYREHLVMFRNIFILPSALLLIISIGLLMLWGLVSFIIPM